MLYHKLLRWKAFFLPKLGWKERLLDFKKGRQSWPNPYNTAMPILMWPVEWLPHRPVIETDTEQDKERGFVFLDTVCAETNKPAEKGVATCCVRCGIHLHPDAANMFSGFDPPQCNRCYWVIKLTVG